jgi:hypothetical protein
MTEEIHFEVGAFHNFQPIRSSPGSRGIHVTGGWGKMMMQYCRVVIHRSIDIIQSSLRLSIAENSLSAIRKLGRISKNYPRTAVKVGSTGCMLYAGTETWNITPPGCQKSFLSFRYFFTKIALNSRLGINKRHS